jgi:hypothetical protein
MNLDEEQRKKVAAWIGEGLKLADIQTRLASELGLKLTYMDVRMLVDDLKLTPKDPERPRQPESALSAPASPAAAATPAGPAANAPGSAAGSPGKVSVSVDQLARPGSMASGKVTFSDGNTAEWYFDTSGRLGLTPQKTGYRPVPADVQQFQMLLEAELSRMGY